MPSGEESCLSSALKGPHLGDSSVGRSSQIGTLPWKSDLLNEADHKASTTSVF